MNYFQTSIRAAQNFNCLIPFFCLQQGVLQKIQQALKPVCTEGRRPLDLIWRYVHIGKDVKEIAHCAQNYTGVPFVLNEEKFLLIDKFYTRALTVAADYLSAMHAPWALKNA